MVDTVAPHVTAVQQVEFIIRVRSAEVIEMDTKSDGDVTSGMNNLKPELESELSTRILEESTDTGRFKSGDSLNVDKVDIGVSLENTTEDGEGIYGISVVVITKTERIRTGQFDRLKDAVDTAAQSTFDNLIVSSFSAMSTKKTRKFGPDYSA